MIEIEYIVKDNQGVERLRTADKKAADAYDKALDIADRLAQLLRDERVVPNITDGDLEELTVYLALNARVIERILKGKDAPLASGDEEVSKETAKVLSLGGQSAGSGADASPLKKAG